jgi:hypothetical protein
VNSLSRGIDPKVGALGKVSDRSPSWRRRTLGNAAIHAQSGAISTHRMIKHSALLESSHKLLNAFGSSLAKIPFKVSNILC